MTDETTNTTRPHPALYTELRTRIEQGQVLGRYADSREAEGAR
jgi:hypothetical protein